MAKEIPEELKTFKEKVNGKLSSMSSGASEIVSKIQTLANESNSTKGQIEANYQSSTEVNQASAKLANTSEILNNIASDINSTITSAVSKANTILDKINKLEILINEIKEQESIISRENSKEKPNSSTISSARSAISTKESDFDSICEEAKSALSELKSMDKTIEANSNSSTGTTNTDTSVGTESTLSTYTGYLQKLAYGTFTKQTFNSSVGKIEYYLYLPDKAESTTGLPVMLWLHGGSAHKTGMGSLTGYGLCPQIQNKEVTPNGIVILPHITDFEGTEGANYRKAVVELTNHVVNTYKADKKRVSIAGASYGAITGYTIINENPGMFSAFVPISGWNKITDEFKNVKVWAFHGTADSKTKNTSYNQASNAMKEINQVGGDAEIHAYDGWGHAGDSKHNIVVTTFKNKFTKDGEKINPLEWAFQQSKSA